MICDPQARRHSGTQHEADSGKLHEAVKAILPYLRGAQISDRGAACFAKMSNLEVLRLTDSGITDKALEVIGRLRKLRYLFVGVGRGDFAFDAL